MTDLTRVSKLVEELYEKLALLEAEVTRLRAGPAPGAPGVRAAIPAPAAPPPPELPNVILPTQTDDPDSIVGGRRTLSGDFQDCCAVGDKSGYYCTGTLIAPNVVVTAKHCTGANRVFLKGNDISRPKRAEIIKAKAIPHPDPVVDLMVLVLKKDSTVAPRRIAQEIDVVGATEATLVGFGTIDLKGSFGYGVKRQVTVPIESLDCSLEGDAERYGCQEGIEIVAGHRGLARDSCRGDSGGPLYIQDADGAYVLLGATSRGALGADHMCGDGGIYVRVDKFLDWIQEVTGAEL